MDFYTVGAELGAGESADELATPTGYLQKQNTCVQLTGWCTFNLHDDIIF